MNKLFWEKVIHILFTVRLFRETGAEGRCEGVDKFGPMTEEFPVDEQKPPKLGGMPAFADSRM